MFQIDFLWAKDRYPELSSKELKCFKTFFNQDEILDILKKFEKKRKKRQKRGDEYSDSARVLRELKKELFPKFLKVLEGNFQYAIKLSGFEKFSESEINQTGLIKDYDYIHKEDYIKYGYQVETDEGMVNSIDISSVECKAFDEYGVNSWNYLTKIKFLNPRFDIDQKIRVYSDKEVNNLSDYISFTMMGLGIIGIAFFIITGILFLKGYFSFVENMSSDSFDIFLRLLFLAFTVFGGFVSRLLYRLTAYWKDVQSKKNSKQRVELENWEFEKLYNVYSKDPIETRKVLRTSFMHRIVEHYKKYDENVFGFYFYKDEVYIKRRLQEDFLEFEANKTLFENLDDYIQFYKELKYMKNIVMELGLYYYDSSTFKSIEIQ